MNFSFLLYVISVVVASFSQILLKKSALQNKKTIVMEYLNPYVICGYVLLVMSMFLTIMAYRGMPYKNGPIIESLGYVFVLFLSRICFREKLTRRKVLGTLCILAGIVIFYC